MSQLKYNPGDILQIKTKKETSFIFDNGEEIDINYKEIILYLGESVNYYFFVRRKFLYKDKIIYEANEKQYGNPGKFYKKIIL